MTSLLRRPWAAPESPRHILSALDLEPWEVLELFELAEEYKYHGDQRKLDLLAGCAFAWLFWEESTRTRGSFTFAASHLGASPGFSSERAGETSSAAKGEVLFRTLHNIIGLKPHAIIVRHDHAGELQKAVVRLMAVDKRFVMPVFNGGDGGNEHPTQFLLNLFTKWELKRSGRLPANKPWHLLFWGDNAGSRTVNSDGVGVAKYASELGLDIGKVTFAGVGDYGRPRSDVISALAERGIELAFVDVPEKMRVADMKRILRLFAETDIVSATRWQSNRYGEGVPDGTLYLDPEYIEAMPAHGKILHPQPVREEIDEDVDFHPKSAFVEQSENGLYIRCGIYHLWVPRTVWLPGSVWHQRTTT